MRDVEGVLLFRVMLKDIAVSCKSKTDIVKYIDILCLWVERARDKHEKKGLLYSFCWARN